MNRAGTLSFVLRAKNRFAILIALLGGQMFSAQLEAQAGMYKSHVSRTLAELEEMKLIACANPLDRSYKFYRLTALGRSVITQANLLRAKKKQS